MQPRSFRWVALVAGGSLIVAACGGGTYKAGSSGSKGSTGSSGTVSQTTVSGTLAPAGSTKKVAAAGGTLNILMPSGQPGTLDPSASYSAASENLEPLFAAALTSYVPNTNPVQVTGYLATNAGVPSDGARVWTFHLKPGVKYSNGQTVTSYDVKYDVERSFSSTVAGGPPYLKMWLQGAASYTGPYNDKKGLPSVETPNASTIIFKLNQPVADFDYLATYPEFSGLPQKSDTGANYQYHMLSSGPYEIKTYQADHTLLLVRNPYWKSSTDPSIKAYPNEINVEEGLSPQVIDQRLIADNGADKNSVSLDSSIQPSDLATVLSNKALRQRSEIFESGQGITYVGLDTQTKPFNSQLVRQAIAWAMDKQTAQTAFGGVYGAGPIANEILGPGVPGYVPGNLYAGPTGNLTKAKQLLTKAGYPHGFATTLGTQDVPAWVAMAETIQTQLAKIGIKVKIQQVSPSVYFSGVIGVPKSEPPMAISQWGSDWDNASTILPDLLNGSQDTQQGPNDDITNFDNKALDAEMTKAESLTDISKANALWADVDTKAMAQAVIIPIIYGSKVFTIGANIVNGSVNVSFGTPDPLDLAVESKG